MLSFAVALPGWAAWQHPWNNPYPAADDGQNVLYAAFRERPKHLDPARSYSSNEYDFIAQIYEPPFQYHYLKRPFELIPLTARNIPKPVFLDKNRRPLPANAEASEIAFSVYDITIQPGARYQPHPAFVRNAAGELANAALTDDQLRRIETISDFAGRDTREVTAADYVYQIKRLANPKVHSPILSVMTDYIVGLKDFAAELRKQEETNKREGKPRAPLDLDARVLPGAVVIDRYTFRITIHGKYPQLLYWMAMPFFAPMAPEVDQFYSQPGLIAKNITLDWYPVGSGPYMLTVNNPNRQMVLERNPNFRGERYPAEGEPADTALGRLADAGKPLPFVDRIVYSLEKEGIPYWNKFLQGYYDRSGVPAESFDQAVRFTGSGDTDVSESMSAQGIHLLTSVATSTFYLGFNMLDPVVGGLSDKSKKLRQAISIAVDYEEQISIFRNGRGIAAQGPIPPGIFGYEPGEQGLNRYVYDWNGGKPRRKSIEAARRLMAEAGYANGIDARTGRPLTLHYESAATGPEEKAKLDWLRKQFEKIGVHLVVRATDYNRFQEKMRKGDSQLFEWGWNADYPDPENFLFLLYGPNKKVGSDGENASNYDNPEFNRLFERMKNMDNGPARLALIREMIDIARRDAPWAWGIHPKAYLLEHAWVHNEKPNQIANNTMKYLRVDPAVRARLRREWNQPVLWPIGAGVGILVLAVVPAVLAYRRRETQSAT